MSENLSETKKEFFSLGISHWKTPLQLRGKFSFSLETIDAIYADAIELGIEAFFVLSTCNRAQFFAHTHNPFLLKELFIKHSNASKQEFQENHFILKGDKAIMHLFELCCGLDSLMLGDLQIVSQIKESIKQAQTKNLLDGYTHRLIQFVLQAYKDVRTDTDINQGPASVAHAAVLFIKARFRSLQDKKIVLFGTGEIGEVTVKNLIKQPIKEVVLINRTRSLAESIAKPLGLRVSDIKDLKNELSTADILIVATSATEPTVNLSHIEGLSHKLLFIDLSVPRNIDTQIDALPHCELIDIDELNNIQDETLEIRRKNIPKAKTIISLHKNEFYDWILLRNISPVIQSLRKKLHGYKTNELELQKNRLSKKEYEKADKLATSIVNKIANQATEYVKSKYRNSEKVVKIIEEMFKLKQ